VDIIVGVISSATNTITQNDSTYTFTIGIVNERHSDRSFSDDVTWSNVGYYDGTGNMRDALIYMITYEGQTESPYTWTACNQWLAEELTKLLKTEFPSLSWKYTEKDVS